MEVYKGVIGLSGVSKEVKQAVNIWILQRQRCYNKNNRSYKTYGALGLTVEYSSREFVTWWLHNLEKRKWNKPTCGRIDHSKGYNFSNIEMQESIDNTMEMVDRLGKVAGVTKRKVVMLDDDGNEAIIFDSAVHVQRELNIHNVSKVCHGRQKSSCGFIFRFYHGG